MACLTALDKHSYYHLCQIAVTLPLVNRLSPLCHPSLSTTQRTIIYGWCSALAGKHINDIHTHRHTSNVFLQWNTSKILSSHNVLDWPLTYYVVDTYKSQLPAHNPWAQVSFTPTTQVVMSQLAQTASQITSTCFQYTLCDLYCPKWPTNIKKVSDIGNAGISNIIIYILIGK